MNLAAQEFTRAYFNAELSTSDTSIPIEQWFEKTAIKLLQTNNYESFVLLDEQNHIITQTGLPHLQIKPDNKSSRESRNIISNNHRSNDNHKPDKKYILNNGYMLNNSLNSTAITYTDERQYWIVANISYQWHTILFLKALIWALLGIFATGVLTLKFISLFQRELVSPINRLNTELNNIINNDLQRTLRNPKNERYIALTNTINKLIELNQDLKNSFNTNIENATQEIREILESVEVQNIELDMERKKAQQISTDKSELLASTSHEIRTPLNGILGFSQLLLKTELNDSQKDYLVTIEQSAQSLLMVINDILDYSRLETGAMSFEYKPINIRELIGEVFQFYAPSANESHLRLIQWTAPDLPNSLLGDPLRLRQVINNLIHHLISLSNWGDLIVETQVTEKRDSKITLKFRIFNTALDITPQQESLLASALKSPRSLQPGKSLPAGNSRSMGIMIAQTLAERMRGKIELQQDNHYSVLNFTIELGLAVIEDVAPSFAHRNIQALICDANPNSQKELKLELLRCGIPVVIEPHLNKIAILIRQKNINLIFIDCATQGANFNKAQFLLDLDKLQCQYPLTIAIVAPSNIRRQLEKDTPNNNIFFIQRPILGAAIVKLLQNATGMPIESAATPSKNLRILIADDNPSNSKLVQTFLQEQGHITYTVENGAQAIEAYSNNRPDIIFMDVQMPLMDGLQATIAIREREKNGQRIPIIALTANTQSEQRARILRAGMDDYLTKPVSADDLKHALLRWEKYSPNSTAHTADNNINNIDEQAQAVNITTTTSNLKYESKEERSSSWDRQVFSLKESLRITHNNAQLAYDMATQLMKELPTFKRVIENPNVNNAELIATIHKLNGAAAYSGFMTLKKITAEADAALQNNKVGEQQHYANTIAKAIDAILLFENNTDIAALFEMPEIK